MSQLRQKIIATAYKQFNAGGATSVTLRSIAKELSVTHPAVYTYFSSKDDLLAELKLQVLKELREQLFIGINPHGTFKQIMYRVSDNFISYAEDNNQRFGVLFAVANNTECAELQLQILEYIDQFLLLPDSNINLPQIMWYSLLGTTYAWHCGEINKARAIKLTYETIDRLAKSQ